MRSKLTYANVMATFAVFIALGGVGYAATDSLRQLNSDQDRPLWSGRTYSVTKAAEHNSADPTTTITAYCDPLDPQIGGGFVQLDPARVGALLTNRPVKVDLGTPNQPEVVQGWSITYANIKPKEAVGAAVVVRCADFGTLHKR